MYPNALILIVSGTIIVGKIKRFMALDNPQILQILLNFLEKDPILAIKIFRMAQFSKILDKFSKLLWILLVFSCCACFGN